jgi:hypothetical protein
MARRAGSASNLRRISRSFSRIGCNLVSIRPGWLITTVDGTVLPRAIDLRLRLIRTRPAVRIHGRQSRAGVARVGAFWLAVRLVHLHDADEYLKIRISGWPRVGDFPGQDSRKRADRDG